MSLRSMTGYAQVRGQVNTGLAFALGLKSVNHRFLDLHFRLPSDTDSLEMKLRRLLKDKMARGHVEITLSMEYAGNNGVALNRQLVASYVQAFRTAADEFGVGGEPDLNVVLRMPGAMESSVEKSSEELEAAVLARVQDAMAKLNQMREEEGRGIETELRDRMNQLSKAAAGMEGHRSAIQRSYADRLQARLQELLGGYIDKERILQETAVLVDRSDIQEEIVRLNTHVKHFLALLDSGGEVGKKLDFLLQEMNREANTLLSKTSGLAGEALKITEMGLLMKAEIEKSREQVQNLELSIVYIVSAPSGSGKSTLVSELFKVAKNLDFSISYTTRPPRGSEQNGKEYFFVTKDQFEAMIAADEFLEHANVFGNYYGTAKRFLREAEARGNDLLLDIDVQGAKLIKRRLPDAVSIFILPPDRETLERRLRNRGEDSEEVIQRRLKNARREIENYSKYEYILVNEKLERATDELKAVLLAERSQRSGKTPSPEELRLLEIARTCRLDQARKRVQSILDSFGANGEPDAG